MKNNRDKCIFDFPLERPHCGLVMGNGNFGAMIWGDERLHLTLNRADFWDHRGGELIVPGTTYRGLVDVVRREGYGTALKQAIPRYEFPDDVFKPQRLPVGRFEVSFVDGIRPVSAELEYSTGTVTVIFSDRRRIRLDLDLHNPALLLRDDGRVIGDIIIRPAWDFPQSRQWLEKYGFVPPERIESTRSWGWMQSCPEDPSLACLCRKSDNLFAIVLSLGRDNTSALMCAEQLAASVDPENVLDCNRSWWRDYWQEVPEIVLPDEWFNHFFKYALYKFAAATNPHGCACGLQGPWHEEYQRAQWSGDFHFNINVQQIYTPAFSCGRLDHLLPLFDMIESEPFMAALKHNFKVMFGVDDGLWFTHAVDDRGRQCGWLNPGSILDPACGAWTALLYWNYYRYSNDRAFLEMRAFPFIRGIMRGYEEMFEEYDGRLSIPLAISAEYGCCNPKGDYAGRDPSYQLAAVHMLIDILQEASSILDIEPEPVWSEIKAGLPGFTSVSGPDSTGKLETRIAVWDGQDLDVCHRHHSHLAGIYPFETWPHVDPAQAEIIDNSIDHWILKGMGQWSEWSIPWAAVIYSRMGFSEAPMMVLRMWKEIFVNEGMATVYLPRFRGIVAHRRHDLKKPKAESEIMQLDGTMGAITALIEMLVYQKDGTVYLFQGIPENWREVTFRNIHLPGGFTIEATRNGVVKVASRSGGTFKLMLGDRLLTHVFQPGEKRSFPGSSNPDKYQAKADNPYRCGI